MLQQILWAQANPNPSLPRHSINDSSTPKFSGEDDDVGGRVWDGGRCPWKAEKGGARNKINY